MYNFERVLKVRAMYNMEINQCKPNRPQERAGLGKKTFGGIVPLIFIHLFLCQSILVRRINNNPPGYW